MHVTLLFSAALSLAGFVGHGHAAAVDWPSIVTSRGDHLPDFSFCGYHASDKSLPSSSSTPAITLDAASGDQTTRIQEALDKVSAAGGGVVRLGSGKFVLSGALRLKSNTVLRGDGADATILSLSKLTAGVPAFTLGNGTQANVAISKTAKITDSYVGIGSSQVTVDSADGLQAGQLVMVQRPVTANWVRQNGMADLVRDGKQQTWLGTGRLVQQPREIKSISGNKVTLTVPLTDALDSKYMAPQLVVLKTPPVSQEIGLENLSITLSPTCSGVVLTDTTCTAPAVSFAPWTVDSYLRNVNITGFNSFIQVGYNASRLTIQNVAMFRDADSDGSSGWASDIAVLGSQVLIQDSGQYGRATARAFAVATMSLTPGPNAVLRHTVQSTLQQIYPHERWAHGFLTEDTDAEVYYYNRGIAGSGHGWSVNAAVAWNVRGPIDIQSPPLGVNWAIGSSGKHIDGTNGTLVADGSAVEPRSLFAAQLSARKAA